jgi:2-polyprenyl-6-methoxyphenol hydroxylase-like FAD-dependent oxidoreductase
MPSPALDADVLIVGAGPVGLFLANECVRRNLRHRIIEARESQSIYSKALAIFPRTLEILDMAGLVGQFLLLGNMEDGDAGRSALHAIAGLFGGSVEDRLASVEKTTLVRPDGYIAFTATQGGSGSLATLRSVLERQLRQSPVTFNDASSSSP